MRAFQQYAELDACIRAGRVDQARRKLSELKLQELPRKALVEVAELDRRIGASLEAVRLLNPIVRPPARVPCDATKWELAEYAAGLLRIGAIGESKRILNELDARENPEVMFHEASLLVSEWDYASAIPFFLRYLETDALTPYRRLVIELNLADAFLYERRYDEAEGLLARLFEKVRGSEYGLLLGNCRELAAQLAIGQEKWAQAERHLADAGALLSAHAGPASFFVEKWKAILALLRRPGDHDAGARLRALREDARANRRWETVRACDRYLAIAGNDTRLLEHVYFGTRFPSFREYLLRDYGWSGPPLHEYLWELGDAPPSRVVCLSSGIVEGGKSRLEPGRLLHRLLAALAGDFYRPLSLASLHDVLWPGVYFNPRSSPDRVHQAIRRLRRWLQSAAVDLAIEERAGFYGLARGGRAAIRVSLDSYVESPQEHALEKLYRRWPQSEFSAREVSSLLQVPSHTARRILHRAVESRGLVRSGRTSAAKYRFQKKA